ncbi:MAG: EAL domain-containing protein [Betaproteobacteria bacterium]|nr:EAL domain-containing protein [Betaproteobacteria bacterium]
MKNDSKESKLHNVEFDSKFTVSDHAAEIHAGQVKLLFQQTSSSLPATLIISVVLALVLWDVVSQSWLIGWLSAICGLTFARYLLVLFYFRKKPSVEESVIWGRLFVIGVLLAGLLWGTAGSIFFVSGSPVHQLFLAFLLGGMVGGAMSTLSSYKGAYLVFSVPTLTPYTYQIIVHGSDNYGAIAMTYLLFLFMMVNISQRLHCTITESLQLRFDNSDLLHRLFMARDDQQAINRELQAQIEQKNLAEKALQSANEQLEQRVMERTEALALSNQILQGEKELFRVTLASIGDAVITTDCLGNITYLNSVAELFTGWHNSEAKGLPLQRVFSVMDVATGDPIEDPFKGCLNMTEIDTESQECLLTSKEEQNYVIDYSVAPIFDGRQGMIGAVLTFRDVTERRKLTQKLAYQAAHDALTGLLNRDEFESRLRKILASARKETPHALLYLDLDQFKVVNDTCGHDAGDELLRQVTALLTSKLRTRDTLARLGGDEFGIILEHCPKKEALRVAHSIREMVQDFRFQWHDKTFTIGVSIGLFPINRSNETLSNALSAADRACYVAKDSGRNRVHTYQSDDRILLKRSGEMQWLPRIQLAMAEKRLCLYFQPIVSVSNQKKLEEHGEILLRLRDEQGKLILPGSFLPSAERYDQMLMIDRWVMEQSLKILKYHPHARTKVIYAINLSAQSLGDENFLNFAVDKIKAYKIYPPSLCFEITENVALADLKHVVRFIATLKELGCRFSMDDFGNGLSSFGYLKDIPLDYLKIDGRLVKDMLTDPVDHAMVEAIHDIGHVIGLMTTAEWVENAKTLELLKEMGVDYAQGFWLAKPYLINKIDQD